MKNLFNKISRGIYGISGTTLMPQVPLVPGANKIIE